MRLAFAGTPEFARVALAAIHAAGHEVVLVLTQPDRPAGRGMKPQASAVKQWALAQGLPVAQPQSLRLDGAYPEQAAQAQAALQQAAPEVMVVAAYGLILPRWVLALPRLGCLNIHASLLPRWRGAAPIHRAIEAGDTHTGVTIMQMDEGLDTGAMLHTQSVPVGQASTATLHDTLADVGAALIVQALQDAQAARLQPRAQPQLPPGVGPQDALAQGLGISYAHKIEKHEAALDWTQPAERLAQRVRAFDPFPGASASLRGERIKCWQAQAQDGVATAEAAPPPAEPGTVVAVDGQAIWVQCGQGVLGLTALQKAGGKRLAAADFVRGFAVQPGERFT